MKTKVVLLIVLCFLFSVGVVLAAKPDFQQVDIAVKGEIKNTIAIPERAVEVLPDVFYLGAVEYQGSIVQGYAFVDYGKWFAKPGTECGNGICEPGENIKKCPSDCGGNEEPDTSSCYSFLAPGAKWRQVEPYIVDTTNGSELSDSFIRSNIALDIEKWEAAAGQQILGDEVSGSVDGADVISPDDKNEVLFGDIEEPGAIGITIVWGIFRGRPSSRELVEWDQVYDDVDFDWSSSGETDKMDFENIATHELGHTVGMGDIYDSDCSEVTMYGYADYGETNKRSLEQGDSIGIRELYR